MKLPRQIGPTVRRAAVFALVIAIALTGCSGGDDTSTSTDPSATTDASTPFEGELPTVTGEFGSDPVIVFPGGEPPEGLQVKVLSEGDGEEVKAGDTLVANYAGYLWEGGDPFDSSFSRGSAAAFSIGTGGVIAGWDEGLVGLPVGSRVLLAIPPDKGYGDTGSGDSIPANATLVFVVDLVGAINKDTPNTPVTDLPAGLPEVTGEAGAAPTVVFPDGLKEPATTESVVLATGTGAALGADDVLVADVLQYAWGEAEPAYSSWANNQPASFKAADIPGLETAVDGQKAGARIMLKVAPEDNEGTPLLLVIDIHGSYPSGAPAAE